MESSVDLIAPEFCPYGNGCAAGRLQYAAHLTECPGSVGKELQALLT
jgi:hypothetical protein